MPRGTIKQLTWTHRFVAVYKCYRRREESQGEMVAEELKVADVHEIEADSDLSRVIGALQGDLIRKRFYPGAVNPTTRFLAFRRYPEGQTNKGRAHLDGLRTAGNKDTVRRQAEDLVERYRKIREVREGILIFLISRGFLGQSVVDDFVFVFKCNFEAISQITAERLFLKIEDAIVEQTKKGALYPYFDRGQVDKDTVRVFDERGETQYWLEFLDMGERRPIHEMMHEVTLEELPKELVAKYRDDLEPRPTYRSLADDDRKLLLEDRLGIEEAKEVIEAVAARVEKPWITFWLDDVRIKAPLSQYLDRWILAEEAGERYLLVKGSNLEIRTKQTNPLDVAELTSLRDAAARLGLPLP